MVVAIFLGHNMLTLPNEYASDRNMIRLSFTSHSRETCKSGGKEKEIMCCVKIPPHRE